MAPSDSRDHQADADEEAERHESLAERMFGDEVPRRSGDVAHVRVDVVGVIDDPPAVRLYEQMLGVPLDGLAVLRDDAGLRLLTFRPSERPTVHGHLVGERQVAVKRQWRPTVRG